MGFPLGDWIDDHAGLPHDLGSSGMGPTLRTARAARRRPEAPDAAALRSELARLVGVRADRLFLCVGASQANALALFYLARRPGRSGSPLRAALPVPEYPPLGDTARWAGFRTVRAPSEAAVALLSEPNNPRGLRYGDAEFDRLTGSADEILVDETFREFTTAASRLRQGRSRLWASGTFTKVYGADDLRVGYLVVPDRHQERFAAFHALVTDSLASSSVAQARALLRDRDRILTEVRLRFRRNRSELQRQVPGAPRVQAPVWFHRVARPMTGDRLARRLLRAGVLVCPGSYFGVPQGVRVGLTHESFPDDLVVYLRERQRIERG